MRKALFVLAVIFPIVANAAEDPDAVIESYEAVFTMNSVSSGAYHVRTTVLVNNEDGLPAGTFSVMTDSFESISSFSGTLIPGGGGKPSKIKSSDLIKISSMSGLADDIMMNAYEPSGAYPFRVSYDYTISFKKGILSFPTFFPLSSPDVSIVKASFALDLPKGTEISYVGNKVTMRDESTAKRDVKVWEVSDFRGIVDEHNMPSLRELAPYVFSSPVVFQYGGYSGTQKDWQSFGAWIASLSEGSDVLTDEVVEKVKNMTDGCSSDYEKVKVLYDYLRETTRYVNISLGIGGLRPIEALKVSARGFGDCKALSNYLKALLKAAGVDSIYYIIDTSRKNLLPGYVASQFNHAMLAVPLKEYGDTLWVECTNPRYPLGYRHSGAADHDVILISEGGGQHVRIPSYPDSLSRVERTINIDLVASGSASVAMEQRMYLDYVESYIGFTDMNNEEQVRKLVNGMKLHPEEFRITHFGNNFNNYPLQGRNYCPEVDIRSTFRTEVYANRSGDTRLFVPMNPFSRGLYSQRSARKNEIVFKEPLSYTDTINVKIPAGYRVESIPEDIDIEDSWGRFTMSSSEMDGIVSTVQTISITPCRREASAYSDYRSFARKVNKAYETSFVLVKE